MPPQTRKRAAAPTNDAAQTKTKKPKTQPISGQDSDDDTSTAATSTKTKKQAPPNNARGTTKAAIKDEPEEDKTPSQKQDVSNASQSSKAQHASTANLVTPVDEGCTLPAAFRVYIDSSDGIIYDAALNQTNASGNNNKFYRVQLLSDGHEFYTWTRWGRVGENGQSAMLGDGELNDAMKNFEKKFKDKSGLKWMDRALDPKPNKYVFVERSYEADSEDEESIKSRKGSDPSIKYEPPECKLEPPVKSLLELIFNQTYLAETMADLNYDANKLPLGKLSKTTITRGYEALKRLAAVLNDPGLAASEHNSNFAAVTEQLSNAFYSTIPHAFGRNRPPIIQTDERLKKEVELLDSLSDMKIADSILKTDRNAEAVHRLDSQFKGLNLNACTPIDRKTDEFTNISDYLTKTRGATHGVEYEVQDVFRIERGGENDRFHKSEYATINSDRRLLWHGSRATNYGGILSQGLRIAPPEAPVSGYMFGKGIYLADMSSKSANYCCHYNSGGQALLLLCEAELGAPMQTLTNASYTAGEDAKVKGLHSTWGQGSTGPVGWKDAKCIHPDLTGVQMPDTTNDPGQTGVPGAFLFYNEYICYDVAQVRLRYLLRVKM